MVARELDLTTQNYVSSGLAVKLMNIWLVYMHYRLDW